MKQLKLIALLSLVAFSVPALAQTKVVIVNLQSAIFSSESAKNAMEKLREDSDYSALQAQLEAFRSDLQALQKERETKGMTWSAEQLAENKEQMETIGSDFQYTLKKAQSQEQEVLQNIMKDMQPKVKKALEEIAKEQNVDLILDSAGTYFVSEKADITPLLTEKLNEAQ